MESSEGLKFFSTLKFFIKFPTISHEIFDDSETLNYLGFAKSDPKLSSFWIHITQLFCRGLGGASSVCFSMRGLQVAQLSPENRGPAFASLGCILQMKPGAVTS